MLFFTLCELKADRVANDPRGPFGLGVGPQQLTGRPAMGRALFCWLIEAIFFERRLETVLFIGFRRKKVELECVLRWKFGV
jgi:hypothetical protein